MVQVKVLYMFLGSLGVSDAVQNPLLMLFDVLNFQAVTTIFFLCAKSKPKVLRNWLNWMWIWGMEEKKGVIISGIVLSLNVAPTNARHMLEAWYFWTLNRWTFDSSSNESQ